MENGIDAAHGRIARSAAGHGLSYHRLTENIGVVLKSSTYPAGCGCGTVENEEVLYQLWVDELGVWKSRYLGVYEGKEDDFIQEIFQRR